MLNNNILWIYELNFLYIINLWKFEAWNFNHESQDQYFKNFMLLMHN
jgi:hypothetical protein